jgi:hypothetical protein
MRHFLLLLLTMAFSVAATPTWMWICTYAINNGPPPLASLFYADETANAFYAGAEGFHPGGPVPYRVVNLVGTTVTPQNLGWSSNSADFVFIAGHGWKRYMAVWPQSTVSPPYYNWPTSEMQFGTGYTRWVYLIGCQILEYDNFNDFFYGPNSWDPAFRGVQCILGYSSTVYISLNSTLVLYTTLEQPFINRLQDLFLPF